MEDLQLNVEDAENRAEWRRRTRVADPSPEGSTAWRRDIKLNILSALYINAKILNTFTPLGIITTKIHRRNFSSIHITNNNTIMLSYITFNWQHFSYFSEFIWHVLQTCNSSTRSLHLRKDVVKILWTWIECWLTIFPCLWADVWLGTQTSVCWCGTRRSACHVVTSNGVGWRVQEICTWWWTLQKWGLLGATCLRPHFCRGLKVLRHPGGGEWVVS